MNERDIEMKNNIQHMNNQRWLVKVREYILDNVSIRLFGGLHCI